MDWEVITPKVNQSTEFLEIASDFGDPFELFREALHNAYDWGATVFSIDVFMEPIDGKDTFIIEMTDNGSGMSKDVLSYNFWNLGDSASKNDNSKIGEKGHGTKIYLRSNKIIVHTSDGSKSYESICEGAFKALSNNKIHTPQVRESDVPYEKGTWIRIEGYNLNDYDFSMYTQDVIKDYLYWNTKIGSIETQFSKNQPPDFKVRLKALNSDQFEELSFGHPFAPENNDINQLFKIHEEDAADYFVKKYVYEDETLKSRPDIKFDAVIYVEGDEAKRAYNPMLRKRIGKGSKPGAYKVSDRYGIYLCKDYVPIQRVNDWVSGFGTGSNSVVMLHGFINCQKMKLTANRGTFANTDASVLKDLKSRFEEILNEIEEDLYKNNINTIKQWQVEAKTDAIETTAFKTRTDLIRKKDYFEINGRTFLEPRNEAELYGLFMSLYSLYPDSFDFEPLDYDASIGVDLVARNKTTSKIADCDYWYIELKYKLGATIFNHSFKNIRYIVCWCLADKVKDGTILESSVEGENRVLKIEEDDNGKKHYFLVKKGAPIRIEVIQIKNFIEEELGIQLLKQ